jgi:hypothetical protein
MISRRTRLLARTAYERFFDNDFFSSSVSASNGVIWLLAALASPGVMVSASQYYFYAHARTFTPEIQDRILFVSQAFHVQFAMAVAGVVTMLVWTSLTPDRRDALVLGPLPLRPGEQARARLIAVMRFFSIFTLAMSVPTAVAFTFVTLGESSATSVLSGIAGHIAAVVLGSALVFFALIDVQLVLAAAFGPRAVHLAAWPLQALTMVAMVGALSFTSQVADALLTANAGQDARVMWNPAAWFVGVYRWIAGEERVMFGVLAARGTAAALGAVAIALLAYPLAFQRCLLNAVAGEGRRTPWWSTSLTRIWLGCLRPWLPAPLDRGLAAFITATLTRHAAHRLLIGGYVGAGVLLALPLVPRLAGPADSPAVQYAWLAVPLGLTCWSATGLRVAMMLPVEPAANWLFKLTEPVDKRRMLATVVTVMRGATAVPLAIVFGAGATLAGGLTLGVTVFGVVVCAGVVLIELLTLTLRAVPGTCTYRPGQLRLRVLWPVYLLVWTTVVYLLPRLAISGVGQFAQSAAVIGTLVATGAALQAWRTARARQLGQLVYDATETPTTTTIDLSSA